MASSSKAVLITQNEPSRYLDKEQLKALLVELFPNVKQADFRIRVSGLLWHAFQTELIEGKLKEDQWTFNVPRLLTDVRRSFRSRSLVILMMKG